LEYKIFSFRNVSYPSAASLAFFWKIVRIEDLVLWVQRRNCMEAPVDIWHMLLIESDDPVVSSFLKLILDEIEQ
jgi:hypothetical protein